jgi:D-ornithine 4,5-aminomutase subunit beta
MALDPSKKLDIKKLLKGLEKYRPRRRGWTWRAPGGKQLGPFSYEQCSEPLKAGQALASAPAFGGIDPQPDCVITTEIASGRLEDDIRRMRMAAWHGADHIMVIRTLGQSHFDGLIEGTPEGVGGVPITRKQLRATRKALDLIEDEVGRPINFHSYVSGVAGPEIAVLFAEEGVNGAHQDPQYNVLYRNVNMLRSYVDAAEAKGIMAWAGMLQIDGAHNANATASEAWRIAPELLVQHVINSLFSLKVGMRKDLIALSTVPPTAPPAPKLRLDLPYAVALRDLFAGFRFRAQQNTRYATADEPQTDALHFLDTLISRLTSADLQSTITCDEARHVPWHVNNVRAVDTAKETLVGLDGLSGMVKLDRSGPLGAAAREITERAVLFLEEMVEAGGYFKAVEAGFFVDGGLYPERAGDGIRRELAGGVGAGTVIRREPEYLAPVCAHFGENHLPGEKGSGVFSRNGPVGCCAEKTPDPFSLKPCALIGGCTLCNPEKIVYIDELDPEDNVAHRLAAVGRPASIMPEAEWARDGLVSVSMFFPEPEETARAAALALAERMGLADAAVIHSAVMHPAEGTLVEVKGRVTRGLSRSGLKLEAKPEVLTPEEITAFVRARGLKAVAGTLGNDEHSAGLREILDIKHGGIEKFGFACRNLGTSVPPGKLVDAAVEFGAQVLLASTIVSHGEVHRANLSKLHQLCVEKGVRDRLLLVGGGPQVTDELARECGLDAGFGRGTKGLDVASLIVNRLRADR